jgi:hypothetical protein
LRGFEDEAATSATPTRQLVMRQPILALGLGFLAGVLFGRFYQS